MANEDSILVNETKTFRFYHFIGAEYVEGFLRTGLLKTTQLGHSNDYFEYKPGFANPNMEWIWNHMIKGNEPCVVCLSTKMSSPVMWGHYGERGRGACVVFDIPLEKRATLKCLHDDEEKEYFAYSIANSDMPLVKVAYGNRRIVISSIPERDLSVLLAEIASSKPLDWKYEQEYRVIVDPNCLIAKNGCFFYDGMMRYCSAVLLGWDCPVTNAYLSAVLKESGRHNIRVVDTYPSLDCFEICSCICNGESYKDTSVSELDAWGSEDGQVTCYSQKTDKSGS